MYDTDIVNKRNHQLSNVPTAAQLGYEDSDLRICECFETIELRNTTEECNRDEWILVAADSFVHDVMWYR